MPLEINNLSISYQNRLILPPTSFELKNETMILFGPSGCGKTSILKAILGVKESTMRIGGEILFNGAQLNKGDVGIALQGPILPTWITLYSLCTMGNGMRTLDANEQKKCIMKILTLFNMDHLVNVYPHHMSGGEKQRAALVLALLNKPKVLLLDEPTTFIDAVTRVAIWNYIEKYIQPRGISTIIVSHDPVEALTLGDKICVLSKEGGFGSTIKVPFSHPRSEKNLKNPLFWDLKKQLLEAQADMCKSQLNWSDS